MKKRELNFENVGAVERESYSLSHEKKETGITLVALVVTIVVLLILAGITIVYVLGDNGIFKLAQEAKEKHEKALEEEKQLFNQLDFDINDVLNEGEYIIALAYNSDYRKYFNEKFADNAFFVIQNSDFEFVFSEYLNLNVSTESDVDSGIAKKWEKFSNSSKIGHLCNENGLLVQGWARSSEEEEIMAGPFGPINIECELEGKERIGTEIDTNGRVFAVFQDGTKVLLGQIVMQSFANPMALTDKLNNIYKGTNLSGESDGIGRTIESNGATLKRIGKKEANQIISDFANAKKRKIYNFYS